ncbi:pyruvate formate lyase activating enzyme [Metarhizium rileyi]|uniref:Pyruvate formate lyase activating enzyme n=1 Tax=Metarhizium rileyi (strain RCEF 4871) TaxID=1649241 RepID=A0A162I001_METRR|nr:pyruvate formate lyase activating enzyme [Metarhizium rileyi RCEF 4871]
MQNNSSSFDWPCVVGADGRARRYLILDFKVWEASTSKRPLKTANYAATARESIKAMQAPVGDLCFTADGIAKRDLLIRHLVMLGRDAEGAEIMKWLASEVSKDCYINIMEQYRPEAYVGKKKRKLNDRDKDEILYGESNRAVTGGEVSAARQAAYESGLWRFNDPPKHDGFAISWQ